MKYDYNKAKKIIEDNKNANQISLGMLEDLGWTIDVVWNKEEGFLVDLDDPNLKIAGIDNSNWATPVAIIETKWGKNIIIECYK